MPLSTEKLLAFLEDKLSPIERPRHVEFRDELPKTMIGKLSKKELVADGRRAGPAGGRAAGQGPGRSGRLEARAMAELYSVSELANDLGVTPRALRFYEDKGLIAPQRAGNTRVYTRRDRGRLMLILRGKRSTSTRWMPTSRPK
jgi:hypothetical protein